MSLSLNPASLVVGISGLSLNRDEKTWLNQDVVGGVILFSRNYESPGQLQTLCKQIRDVKSPRLFICVDQEGGRVQRFREGFFSLPPPASLGALYNENREYGGRATHAHAWIMINELLAAGLDFSLAPVVDLAGPSKVIGDRALHADPAIVSILAGIYCHVLSEQGSYAVAKHFPGHGSVEADSHTHHPIDDRPAREIIESDMAAFSALIKSPSSPMEGRQARHVDGIMMSHVIYSALDTSPAGFSAHWTQQVLGQSLGFGGSIFSDDLGMQAASSVGGLEQRVAAASKGCDFMLLCQPESVESVISMAKPSGVSANAGGFLFKGARRDWDKLHLSSLWQQNTEILLELLES